LFVGIKLAKQMQLEALCFRQGCLFAAYIIAGWTGGTLSDQNMSRLSSAQALVILFFPRAARFLTARRK
jgi:hypothetical protein